MTPLDHHWPAIVAGDADAFGRWVAGAEARLRLSLSSFARVVDVEAVVQESLLRMWQVAGRIEIRPEHQGESSLRFAIRVARNLAIDESRRARTSLADPPTLERMLEAADPAAETEDAASDPILRRALALCIEALPAKPKAVFMLRLGDAGALGDHQLAAQLKMKRNTFLQNFTRARKYLVECLAGRGVRLDEVGRVRP